MTMEIFNEEEKMPSTRQDSNTDGTGGGGKTIYSSSDEEDESKKNNNNSVITRRSKPRILKPRNRKTSTPGTNHYSMTCLERLIRAHPIWFLPKVNREDATQLLQGKETGAFIIRQSSQSNTLALSVSEQDIIEHYLIEPSKQSSDKLSLESSDHSFDNVLSLVYHYSTTKDELPTTLALPTSLRDSDSRQHLSSMALLGKDFWKYPMSQTSTSDSRSMTPKVGRRKLSEPINSEAKATLEETLNGLQKVSDMLQASLIDLEQQEQNQQQNEVPPVPPPRVSSSPLQARKSVPVDQMNSADMLRSNQPIVHLRTRLSEEMFGTTETNSSTNTKQWYSYYRSSIADKMSDYEDIWDKSETTRCLSPAESEIQFKAYLATKLSEEADPDPFHMPSSNSDSEEPRSSSTTDLSSLSSSSDDLSTSLSSDDEDNNNPTPSTESFSSPDAEEEEELTDNLSTIDESTEVIYSDPLDALEKATDTRIYNCPEFDENEEVIYEEAGQKIDIIPTTKSISPKQSPKSPKRRKRATMSTSTDVPQIKNPDEKNLQRRSHSYVQNSVSKFSSIKSSGSENKRLSMAVLSKYIKPSIAKQSWQVDSSSWEFLHQTNTTTSSNSTEKNADDFTEKNIKQDSSNTASSQDSEKSKHVDSGLDSTLSFTNKSDDKDSVYESEMGTLNTDQDDQNKSQLVKSQEKIKDYVTHQLATDQWMFGRMISQFNECTQKVNSNQILSTLSNIRQFMNGMKNYLVRHGEGELHQIIKDERMKLNSDEFLNVDLILEEIMHTLILGPLTVHLREALRKHLNNISEESTTTAQTAKPKTESILDPACKPKNMSTSTMSAFRECFVQMRNSISPLDKLAHLLTALKVIINSPLSMSDTDEFCGQLAHIILELEMSDWVGIDLELMWNILPQSVLRGLSNGEATYYLTLMSSAVNLIKSGPINLMPLEDTSASLKSTSSTTSCTMKLTVYIIPESGKNHLVSKSVPLRNDSAKVKDICALLTHMVGVSNPSDYGLYSIIDGEESHLGEDEQPLLILDQARIQGRQFCAFAFQRKDSQNAWPLQMGIDLSKSS